MAVLLLIAACAPRSEPADDPFRGAPSFAGTLRRDAASRARAGSDFGGMVQTQPAAVLEPKNAEDVERAVRWARSQRIRVVPRGNGHAMEGQAQGDDALVIDMRSLHRVGTIAPDHVTVDAGATWHDVVKATVARGLRPPVLPGYLGLTVGGTLSVGGVGPGSALHGLQVDHVRALDVVTGLGEQVRCSTQQHADLCESVLGGLGQFGVIVRAELALVPAPASVHRVIAHYDEVADFDADVRALLAGAARLGVAVDVDGRVVTPTAAPAGAELFLGVYATDDTSRSALLAHLARARSTSARDVSYLEHITVGETYERMNRAAGDWQKAHRWLNVFVRPDALPGFLDAVRHEYAAEGVTPLEYVQLLPIHGREPRMSIAQGPEGLGKDAFYNVGLIQTARTLEDARTMTARVRRLLAWAVAHGSRTYPIDALPDSPAAWRAHLGPAAATLRERKRRFDPDDILGAQLGLSRD